MVNVVVNDKQTPVISQADDITIYYDDVYPKSKVSGHRIGQIIQDAKGRIVYNIDPAIANQKTEQVPKIKNGYQVWIVISI